jgi:methylase of polypeptide subunit release factors
MIHGERSNGKAHGVVNTKPEVVAKMLDLVEYKSVKNLSSIKIIEPSAGTGAFAIEILKRLHESSVRFRFDFQDSLSNIYLCEIDETISSQLETNIGRLFKSLKTDSCFTNLYIHDFLRLETHQKFDIIIGNPPYVRNENIPEDSKAAYQSIYKTFTHRSDLYIPFYEKGLKLLKEEGLLSYLCSNRWLKNQYGKKLRELITNHYQIRSIIDLEKADIFEEDVLGYPAITTIVNSQNSLSSLYSEVFDLNTFLDFEQNDSNSINLNLRSSNWFAYLYIGEPYEKFISKIEEQNFKIGIGVATGRDSIYISTSFQGRIEDELLIPIITSKGLKSTTIQWKGSFIINPFKDNGDLINLDDFPLAKNYFLENKEELSKRHVAKKDQNKYYKTIDKIHKKLIKQPKILLPDISGNRFIHVDEGNYYPHHNLYYITGGTYRQMCILASILMSDFVYEQLLHIGNKMKGGYPRWQSQNIRKLRIPLLNAMPESVQEFLFEAYNNNDLDKINSIVTTETIENFEITKGQGVLFDEQMTYERRITTV